MALRSKKKSSKTKSSKVLFQIQVSNKQQNSFSFEMEGKTLASYIDKLLVVTGHVNSNAINRRHLFVSYNKTLYLVGYSSDTHIAINTGIETKVTGSFNFDADILKGVVKGKSDLNFEYDGSELNISSGRFKAGLKTSPITVDQIPAINDLFGQGIKHSDAIGAELLSRLKLGSQRTRVIDHHDDKVTSPMNITVKDGKLVILSFSRWSFNRFECEVESPRDIELTVSNEVFTLVSKVLDERDEDSASFFVEESGFRVLSENLIIGLPPLSSSEEDSLENVNVIFDGTWASKSKSLYLFSVNELSDTISNIRTLITDRNAGYMTLKFGAKGVTLSFSNDNGNAQDSVVYAKPGKKSPFKKLPAPKKASANIHPHIFGDVLLNMKGTTSVIGLTRFELDKSSDTTPNTLLSDSYIEDELGTVRIRQIASLRT